MDNQEKTQNEIEETGAESVKEVESSAPEEQKKPQTIKKRLGIAILCLVLVISAALGYTLWQNQQPPVVEPTSVEEVAEEPSVTAEEVAQTVKASRMEQAQKAASAAAQRKELKYFTWNPQWGSNAVVPGQYYFAGVNREQGVVTIYVAGEGSKFYDTPVRAMICSGGEDTIMSQPGTAFRTSHKYRWRVLSGNVYGQYAVRISGPYLFHSVPYYSPSVADLEYPEYNKLGTVASMGCIRMSVVDVKWIYDNCALGMPVVIYNDPVPGPLGKPERFPIDEENEALRGWDPTDCDSANPYRNDEKWTEYEKGTAIEANTDKIIYNFGVMDPLGSMWG